MHTTWAIFKREFSGYFITPIAYVFLAIFVFLSGIFAFYLGTFFERGQADLVPFFSFHPWLYLFFIPALSMRLWAEERRSGTIELLLSQLSAAWSARRDGDTATFGPAGGRLRVGRRAIRRA